MILLVCSVFIPEPVVSALASNDLAIALAEKYGVTVVSPKPTRPYGFVFQEDKVIDNRFEHVTVNSFTCPKSKLFGRMRESYSFGKYVVNYINANKDKLECVYVLAWPLLAQYLIVKALKKYSIPSAVHVQDIYPESLSNKLPLISKIVNAVLLPIDKYILHNADRVVAISENMASIFVKTRGISRNKIDIVQNWQDESGFCNFHSSNSNSNISSGADKPFVYMYMGNIGPVAGVDHLIDSFSKLNDNGSKLVIAGSGSKKEELQIKAAALKNVNIEFWDVPQGMVPEVQSKADVMLLPIIRGAALSSIPSKLPAYMFSKKPIIACAEDDSDTAKAIISANCGWVVPPEDIHSLVSVMKNVKGSSKDDMQILGKNGFDYSIENYSKQTNLNKLINVITSMLAK